MNLPKFLLYPFLESHPWCLARRETLRGVLRPFDQPIARPSRYFVDFGCEGENGPMEAAHTGMTHEYVLPFPHLANTRRSRSAEVHKVP